MEDDTTVPISENNIFESHETRATGNISTLTRLKSKIEQIHFQKIAWFDDPTLLTERTASELNSNYSSNIFSITRISSKSLQSSQS